MDKGLPSSILFLPSLDISDFVSIGISGWGKVKRMYVTNSF